MELESLNITRVAWGDNAGKLDGNIMFKNPKGKVQIILSDSAAQRILEICAEGLVETAKIVANELTAEIISHGGNLLMVDKE